jgi:EAL domain-containing protein (putative c-di-GMP-specific phosphodiesterase class I)
MGEETKIDIQFQNARGESLPADDFRINPTLTEALKSIAPKLAELGVHVIAEDGGYVYANGRTDPAPDKLKLDPAEMKNLSPDQQRDAAFALFSLQNKISGSTTIVSGDEVALQVASHLVTRTGFSQGRY